MSPFSIFQAGRSIKRASKQTRVPAVRKNVEKWERSEQREMKESRKKRNFAPLPPGLALHFSTPTPFPCSLLFRTCSQFGSLRVLLEMNAYYASYEGSKHLHSCIILCFILLIGSCYFIASSTDFSELN